MFPNEGGQKHVVRDTKGQLNSKEKDGYRAESDKESCVKQDGQITEERDKQRLEQDRKCGKHLQRRVLVVNYLSMSSLMEF